MTKAHGIATAESLQKYLESLMQITERMRGVISAMKSQSVSEIPKFGDNAMRLAIKSILTGVNTCEKHLETRSLMPWEAAETDAAVDAAIAQPAPKKRGRPPKKRTE